MLDVLGCFHLVSTVDLSFMYYPFAEAFQTFSRIMLAKKSNCSHKEGALPCSAQEKAIMMQALTATASPERPFEITEVGRKRYCPKYRFMYNINKNTNKGLVHHETALQLKENSSYIPMQVGRESVFLLTLRWRAFSYMV